jgi:hypothetical protein
MSRSKVPKLLSLLYVHNPFYLISACLFVFGLKLLFRAGDSSVLFQRGSVAYIEPWGLLGSLAGITILMAVTAILIVRLGKVWEDARSVVLIVLLMLLAISVSSDELVNVLSDKDNSMRHLAMMFGLGTSFALLIGELLIRGLPIRLPAGYRLPLYGFLILFFAWPAILLPEVTSLSMANTRWLIAAFPLLSGVLTLTLIPAIRKGSAAVKDNGTPWGWPLFPWTPFVFIALAVCFRSFSLTMSFDPLTNSGHYWDTTFGLYQLVPFLLTVLVVLLEIAIVENLPKLQRGVMLWAPGLLLLAYPWLVPWSRLPGYSAFTYAVVDEVASPVFLTLIGLALLYSWAWWKGVRHAAAGVFGMVLLTTVIGPNAFGHRTWQLGEHFSWWPLLALATIQMAIGIRRGHSFRTFVSLMVSIFVITRTLPDLIGISGWEIFIGLHLLLAATITVGLCFQDGFAGFLKEIGPPCVSMTMLSGQILLYQAHSGPARMTEYAVVMTVLPFALAWLLNNRDYLTFALLHCAVGAFAGLCFGVYVFFRTTMPPGVKPVILAVTSFVVAVFISVLKSGLSRRLRMCWLTKQRRTAA